MRAQIDTFRSGITVTCLEEKLDSENIDAFIDLIRSAHTSFLHMKQNAEKPSKGEIASFDFDLDLTSVKQISVDAICRFAELKELVPEEQLIEKGECYFPYLFSFVTFGVENLALDEAKAFAQVPSHFLLFENIKYLSLQVAEQFTDCGRSLSFSNCLNLSSETLSALVDPAGGEMLSLGLEEVSIEQAIALSSHSGDLLVNAKKLSKEVQFV